MTTNKPIPLGAKYLMEPGATYRDICEGMRLDESQIEAGLIALELINGPEEMHSISRYYEASTHTH